MAHKEELKKQILELTREYYNEVHGQPQEFVRGILMKIMEAGMIGVPVVSTSVGAEGPKRLI